MAVARRAGRIVELRDGMIVSDRRTTVHAPTGIVDHSVPAASPAQPPARWRASLGPLREAMRMALAAMRAHRLRTFLTMLGIIIGIASVICVVALGEGSRRMVLSNISNLGTNTLEIFPGKDFGEVRSANIKTHVIPEARAHAEHPHVAAATPTVSTNSTLRHGSAETSALVNGVGCQYFEVKGTKLAEGQFFDADSVRSLAQDVVIDDNARKALFANFAGSAVGQIVLVGKVPCRVVGIMRPQQSGFGSSANPSVYLPYATVQARFLGDSALRSIALRISDDTATDLADQAVTRFLAQRHGTKDFFILNTDDIRQTITSTTQILTLLIAAIAVISLIVGGIGVMNIMLVSVSERIGEIGVRMAVGARRSDILQQFLIEAILVCLIGGAIGILTALAFGIVFNAFGPNFRLVYSTTSIIVAFLCSTLIGIVFGYLPARNASLLEPVDALSR
jgi:macrolide transport system ATP-binding/permease protein